VTGRIIDGNQPEPNYERKRQAEYDILRKTQSNGQGDGHYPRIEPESRKRYWHLSWALAIKGQQNAEKEAKSSKHGVRGHRTAPQVFRKRKSWNFGTDCKFGTRSVAH